MRRWHAPELSRALYLDPRAPSCLPRALLASSVQLPWWVPVLWRRLRALEPAVAERPHSQSAQCTTGASWLGLLTAPFESYGAGQSHALRPSDERAGTGPSAIIRLCWRGQNSASSRSSGVSIGRGTVRTTRFWGAGAATG